MRDIYTQPYQLSTSLSPSNYYTSAKPKSLLAMQLSSLLLCSLTGLAAALPGGGSQDLSYKTGDILVARARNYVCNTVRLPCRLQRQQLTQTNSPMEGLRPLFAPLVLVAVNKELALVPRSVAPKQLVQDAMEHVLRLDGDAGIHKLL